MLSADIDLDNKPWTPIGHASESVYKTDPTTGNLVNIYTSKDSEFKLFAGEFDGQNHKVSNLVIDKAGKENEYIAVALFGVVKNGSTIKNLIIENASIKADFYTGTLVGYIPQEEAIPSKKTTIDNITLQGDITVDGYASVGGMIGRSEVKTCLEVKNSKINVSPKSSVLLHGQNGFMIGGLVGVAYGPKTLIENCSTNINVIGKIQVVGGLVGHMEDGTINKSAVSGTIKLTPAVDSSLDNNGYDQYGIGAYIGTVDSKAIDTTNDIAPLKTSNGIIINNCTSTAKIDAITYDNEPLFFEGLVGTIRYPKQKTTYKSVDATNIVKINK